MQRLCGGYFRCLREIERRMGMGRRSTRENKNIYQQSRENAGLSREAAAQELVFVSSDRIEKIEYETSAPHPEEVLAMAKCYKVPSLCNYYCSHECPIGQEYVPEVTVGSLEKITLEMMVQLNALDREKERLMEITVDGKISPDEREDFARIRASLEKMEMTIDAMKLWMDDQAAGD